MGHADGRCVADEHMSFRLWTMIIKDRCQIYPTILAFNAHFFTINALYILFAYLYTYIIYICNSVIICNRKNDRLPPFSVFPVRSTTGFFLKDPRRPPSCASWCAADHLGIFDKTSGTAKSGPEVSMSGAFCMVL